MVPSRISKLNTALQFLVVGCGLTSAAFALPPPPREQDAALLRWSWRGGERGSERTSEGGLGPEQGPAPATADGASAALGGGGSAEPARLVLPLLVVAVGATTLASGVDYFVKAARVLSRFR